MLKPASLILAAAIAGSLALWGAADRRADAHSGATGVVKERMMVMESLGDAMKAIKAAVTAQPEMQRGAIAEEAKKIARFADRIPGLFPKGSEQHPSEVKPDVWQSWDAFVKANEAMKTEAEKLVETSVKADRRTVLGQFVRTARSCGGCHERFRKTKP